MAYADTPAGRTERRYQQLARQAEDSDFLRQISTFLEAIDGERSVRHIVQNLRAAAEKAVDQFNKTEQEFVGRAIEIRERLVAAAPEIDNSLAPEPDQASHAYGAWMLGSLANFDRLAEITEEQAFHPFPHYDRDDKTPLRTMLIILRDRLQYAQTGNPPGLLDERVNRRPELDGFWREINNLQARHDHALAAFKEQSRTLPGLAYERLRAVSDALVPAPFIVTEGEDDDAVAERAFRRGLEQLSLIGYFRNALAGPIRDAGERQMVTEGVNYLRGEAERLNDEIAVRLGRGDGVSRTNRVLTYTGRGSFKAGLFVVGAITTAVIGTLVTLYVAPWVSGGRPAASPTKPTVERNGDWTAVTLGLGESQRVLSGTTSITLKSTIRQPDGTLAATWGMSGVNLSTQYEWQEMELGTTEDIEGLYQVRLAGVVPDAQRATIEVRRIQHGPSGAG